jgi:hypothetical protein
MPATAKPAATAAVSCVEPLEDRQMFSTSFFVSFNGGGGGGFVFGGSSNVFGSSQGSIGLPSRVVTLSRGPIGLPSQVVNLPQPATNLPGPGLPSFSTAPARDLRGMYRGTANVLGVGTTRLNVSITRQRGGTIAGTFSLPRLDESFSGTVPVTFLGNRRFTFTFSSGSDTATVTARQNRDGSISGSVLGQLDTRRLDATFSVRPIRNTTGRP